MQTDKLERASTHESATTHAGNVICASWPSPLTFLPKINVFQELMSMLSLVILAA